MSAGQDAPMPLAAPLLLDARDLAVSYGDVAVIWQAHITVPAGSIVALVGSNGAGKTTLLKTLAGTLRPRRGTILLDGQDVTADDARGRVARGLVLVPEGRRLFAGLSVYDNLLLGAYARTDRRQVRADVERIYALFPRLAERRRQDASTLSGGEQQMCAIARGLMADPRLLLIDELSLGLAPAVVEELVAALKTINAAGTSLLVVEQDVAIAFGLADYAHVLDQGCSGISGPVGEIAADPAVRRAYLGI
ncbi:ABC transporter ATP-binding protein [Xanthobacter oligotrophicus]|uniref:ABC transporter ATP-binding protein n=1 Tax=Xanthobacter oligotrophicus TaxID=2607286 RepID=UPI001E55BE26|nr:ABC transporter ATP-binding protein [Xanthobacter oligotrophicus]MCG5237872.1 ABC transporter ATP-binding protein [Xanthobacter oligotrophicus]